MRSERAPKRAAFALLMLSGWAILWAECVSINCEITTKTIVEERMVDKEVCETVQKRHCERRSRSEKCEEEQKKCRQDEHDPKKFICTLEKVHCDNHNHESSNDEHCETRPERQCRTTKVPEQVTKRIPVKICQPDNHKN